MLNGKPLNTQKEKANSSIADLPSALARLALVKKQRVSKAALREKLHTFTGTSVSLVNRGRKGRALGSFGSFKDGGSNFTISYLWKTVDWKL